MNLSASIHRTRVLLSDLTCSFKKLPPLAEIKVPYFSQFMSADLVEKYIERKESLNTDPHWQLSGAANADEYELWTWSDCGIACFKMILAAQDDKAGSIPLIKLAKESESYGAFKVADATISALHYAEFCKFVREMYGMRAWPVPALSLSRIKEEVSIGNFVIVSVHPSIRHPQSIPPKRGGHLILAVGYDDERGGFYFHNPSGYRSNGSQERAFVSYGQFKKFFAYRGIVVQAN